MGADPVEFFLVSPTPVSCEELIQIGRGVMGTLRLAVRAGVSRSL